MTDHADSAPESPAAAADEVPGAPEGPARAAGPARLALGAVPIAAAVGAGALVERVTGFPAVVAGLLALGAALVASPRLLQLVEPVAEWLVRLLPLLFVPLCASVVEVGGDVRTAWPAAVVGVALSVPLGFLVTARLAAGRVRRGEPS